jgi:4-hydroxybenzoyl-CoA reductase subunit beta
MRLPAFQYFGPVTRDEVLALLASEGKGCAIIGGGTEIMGRMKHRLIRPDSVISLKGVAGLSGITRVNGEIHIGAMTTLREIGESPLLGETAAAVVEAARAVAAPPIQNIGTIGGNTLQNTRCLYYNQSELVRKGRDPCHKAGGGVCYAVPGSKRCFSVYQGDIAPVLVAYGATATLERAGSVRTVPVAELFSGDGTLPLSIAPEELLTDITIPALTGSGGSSYQKLRLRSSVDYALMSAAVVLSAQEGLISRARVVLGASGPAPQVVDGAAGILEGRAPDDVDVDGVAELGFKASEGINNLALPGAYRREMARVFTRRALSQAISTVKKDQRS